MEYIWKKFPEEIIKGDNITESGQSTIQEVLFFPQMRPEKITPKDTPAKL